MIKLLQKAIGTIPKVPHLKADASFRQKNTNGWEWLVDIITFETHYEVLCYHRFTFLSNLPTFLSFDMHWHSEPPPPHLPLSFFGAGTRKLVASICHGNPATKPSISCCWSYLKVQMHRNAAKLSRYPSIKHFNCTQTVLFVPKVAGTR